MFCEECEDEVDVFEIGGDTSVIHVALDVCVAALVVIDGVPGLVALCGTGL